MVKIVTNNLGSGDWIAVVGPDGTVIFEGHNVLPFNLEDILRKLGHEAEVLAVTDEEIEEGTY
jgi:hypothetical protein